MDAGKAKMNVGKAKVNVGEAKMNAMSGTRIGGTMSYAFCP